jgi:hypothetical protein
MSMLLGGHFQIGYVWALPEGGYEFVVSWAAMIAVFAMLGGGQVFGRQGTMAERAGPPPQLAYSSPATAALSFPKLRLRETTRMRGSPKLPPPPPPTSRHLGASSAAKDEKAGFRRRECLKSTACDRAAPNPTDAWLQMSGPTPLEGSRTAHRVTAAKQPSWRDPSLSHVRTYGSGLRVAEYT